MEFATNYSPQAAALLTNGDIQIDLFKCPAWPDLIAEARKQHRTYVHFSLRAGRGRIGTVQVNRIAEILRTTDTPYVNMHLSPNASDFEDMPLETRDDVHAEQLANAVERDILVLIDRFGSERVILENSMWDPDPPYQVPRPVLEPELIRRIILQTGCGFVLDLAHARVAAKYLGVDERNYVLSLPMDSLRELHVTGLIQHTNGAWKDHFAMTKEDWDLTEWAIDRIRRGNWPRPWVMTFEYGGIGPEYEYRSETEVLAQQVPRLYSQARSVETGQ